MVERAGVPVKKPVKRFRVAFSQVLEIHLSFVMLSSRKETWETT
jgi:hypothetical protein